MCSRRARDVSACLDRFWRSYLFHRISLVLQCICGCRSGPGLTTPSAGPLAISEISANRAVQPLHLGLVHETTVWRSHELTLARQMIEYGQIWLSAWCRGETECDHGCPEDLELAFASRLPRGNGGNQVPHWAAPRRSRSFSASVAVGTAGSASMRSWITGARMPRLVIGIRARETRLHMTMYGRSGKLRRRKSARATHHPSRNARVRR